MKKMMKLFRWSAFVFALVWALQLAKNGIKYWDIIPISTLVGLYAWEIRDVRKAEIIKKD
jgi:uncharacterized membrane protein